MNDTFASGYAAFRAGDYGRARELLATSDHPQALHLRGLVERRSGNLARAAELLERAAEREPGNYEIAHNRALVALERQQPKGAERLALQALKLKPDFARARGTLGRALLAQKRWEEAQDLYEKLYADDASSVSARYGLASALLERGESETALAHFDALFAAGRYGPEVRFMRARTQLELGDIDAALADLRASHAAQATVLSLRELANVLWMTERNDDFDALLTSAHSDPALAATAAELWRQCGATQRAVAATRALPPAPDRDVVAALAYIDEGDAQRAQAAARRCLSAEPDNAAAVSALVSAYLMQGDAEQALACVRPLREREPLGQHWIAYEATALRMADPDAYATLVDLDRLVRPYDLPVPAAYASLEAFNDAFLAALNKLHVARTHPLGQSLRQGTQTPRDLRAEHDPAVVAYLAALDGPIRQYLRDVGDAAGHPLTERNRGDYQFAGCWSVCLHGGGRHISHVHPEGWISSAYYVSVPPETAAGADHAGWIKFGEPPFVTRPALPPQKWVQPRAGLVVLFPSYLWHGTHPIGGDSVRVTAPFDLIPAR